MTFLVRPLLFLSFLTFSLLYGDAVWTQKTTPLSAQQSEKILQNYQENNQTDFEFEDDITPIVISDIEDNILVVGLSLGYGSQTETVSNTRGSYDKAFTLGSIKMILGKDLTLWHEEYTQPVRLYLSLDYTKLSNHIDYLSYTFGIRENMRYWPLYSSHKHTLYPMLSYELGTSRLYRAEQEISGITSELAAGIVYQYGNFEYAFNLAYHQVSWNHPIEGIKDEVQGLQAQIHFNYRWMYDD